MWWFSSLKIAYFQACLHGQYDVLKKIGKIGKLQRKSNCSFRLILPSSFLFLVEVNLHFYSFVIHVIDRTLFLSWGVVVGRKLAWTRTWMVAGIYGGGNVLVRGRGTPSQITYTTYACHFIRLLRSFTFTHRHFSFDWHEKTSTVYVFFGWVEW